MRRAELEDVLSRAGLGVDDIARADTGHSGQVFTCSLDGQPGYCRFMPHDKARLHIAIDALLRAHHVPLPELLAMGLDATAQKGFLIHSVVSGKRLHRWKRKPESDHVLAAAGKTLADIHAIPCHGYGRLTLRNDRVAGEKDSWRAYLEEVMPHATLEKLTSAKILSTAERKAFERMFETLAADPPDIRLLHRDYSFSHVYSDGQRITAIIDWGNAISGDPLLDLAMAGHFSRPRFEAVLSGYDREVDHEKLEQYLAFVAVQKAHWAMKRNAANRQTKFKILDEMRPVLDRFRRRSLWARTFG